MKKQIKQTTDLRKDWKNEAEDEIILLQEDIDMLELDEKTVLQIESLINAFKGRLNEAINKFDVTPAIALDKEDLLDDMLFDAFCGRYTPTDSELERMIDLSSDKGIFIKIDSLAERIRVENFVEELTENPYQLKLIAC